MQFIDPAQDVWQPTAEADPAGAPAFPLLTLAQWLERRAQWLEPLAQGPAARPVGIAVPNDADIEVLAPDLARLALVALQFPKWTDGRAYSQARLLRARWRFAGQVRATGDVVADMLPLLARTGFDAVVLRADQNPAIARRALGFFASHYQGDVRNPQPLFARLAA